MLRSVSANGRVFFVGGKIAWATASNIKKNFSMCVAEATGLSMAAVQKIFDDCKRTGKNFGETVMERGLLDEAGLRRLLLEYICGCLKEMLDWAEVETSFSPERRVYRGNLTFTLAEVLQKLSEADLAGALAAPAETAPPPTTATTAPGGERICPRCGKHHPDSVSYCSTDGTRLTASDGAPPAQEEGPALVGSVIGSYRLMELLGEGGMGYVYLAEHTRLARKVALKMLRREYADSAGAVRRFFMEARAVNQIRHENIVEITDFVEDEGGRSYYIMELLEGQSLDELLSEKGPLSARRAMAVAVQVASALEAVHQAGIVHRDLKPENIFLCERGERKDVVKLLDFGVAKLAGPLPDMPVHRTAAGAILGTPEYMSPEQVSGKEVDWRTDIYSLGIIMFEMVTGKKPFSARTFGELVIKHLTVKPPRPSQLKDVPVRLPRAFEELIMQCLEKDPLKRPQSMREIEERLRKFTWMNSAQLQALDANQMPSAAGISRLWKLVGGGLALLVVGGALVFWLSSRPEEGALPAPPPVPAPPEKPPESPPPVLGAKVEIGFVSVPPGAEVFRPGGKKPLGRTPCRLSFDRGAPAAEFEFRLPGYIVQKHPVTFEKDVDINVVLVREKKPALKPEGKRPALPTESEDSEDTIDPFSE